MSRLILPVLLLVLLAPMPGLAEQVSPAQLRELRTRLQSLQTDHGRDLRQRDRLAAELRDREAAIARLDQEQARLQEQEADAREQLERLRQQQQQLAGEQSRQLRWLAQTVRSLYGQGREPTTKLLLSQEQPDQVARLMRYYDYLQRAQSRRIETLRTELAALLQVSVEVGVAREGLRERQAAVAAQQLRLNAAREERTRTLNELNRQLGRQEQLISALRADETRLQQLLEQMNQVIADIPAHPSGEPFPRLRGRLPWPLQGRVRVAFGASKAGGLKWNGIVIQADVGTPVQAVHSGRVVFADWIRGYGYTLILDHGDGYLSLYGQNQSLLRTVGDWVAPGEAVARSGDSGGGDTPGLYFEIRHQGQPVNPNSWISRRATLPGAG